MKIRPAIPQDGQQITALMIGILKSEGIYQEEYHEKYPDFDLDEIEKAYFGQNGSFFVAEEDGKIIGSLGVFGMDKNFAQIRRFYVHPDFRGRGIGKTLLEKVLELCKKKGFAAIIAVTETELTRAFKVYGAAGFEVFKPTKAVNYMVKFLNRQAEKRLFSRLNQRQWFLDFDGENWKERG